MSSTLRRPKLQVMATPEDIGHHQLCNEVGSQFAIKTQFRESLHSECRSGETGQVWPVWAVAHALG